MCFSALGEPTLGSRHIKRDCVYHCKLQEREKPRVLSRAQRRESNLSQAYRHCKNRLLSCLED